MPNIIKVCGITRGDDALACLAAGANALGFNFYRSSPRYITPARARAIAAAVPGPYLKVGVFVNAAEDELLDVASAVPLDVLQLHGVNPALHLANTFRVWRAIGMANSFAPARKVDGAVEAYLLDAPSPDHGGSGQTFDWSRAAEFPARTIIAGGLDGSNVARAIEITAPWGVDACSRLESQPGRKDPARVRDFVEAARAAFHMLQEVTK